MDSNGNVIAGIIFILLIISTSGCIKNLGGSDGDSDSVIIRSDDFVHEGSVETLAQANPSTVTEEIHFQIHASNVIRIMINVSIDDNDDNTGTDHIDGIRMWRENRDDPNNEILEANGGDTPYRTSLEFEYNGDEEIVDWWIVEITATCLAGEDQWIGPIIWNGVPDNGVYYVIESNFDYLEYPDPSS